MKFRSMYISKKILIIKFIYIIYAYDIKNKNITYF